MGLFDKKYCDICGEKIGLLGNRKLDDGNMCKNCAALLSPFMTDRRRTTVDGIKEHLAYREANKSAVAAFNVTRTIGDRTKVMLDENAGKFIVTSSSRWQNENPDVIEVSQVTGCAVDIRETKTELKTKDNTGKEVSFSPRRYEYEYDFYVNINVNSPYFDEIKIKLNSLIVNPNSRAYRDYENQADEIRIALTKKRENVSNISNVGNVGTPAPTAPTASTAPQNSPQNCPSCGATTVPDKNGRCEFCGGEI